MGDERALMAEVIALMGDPNYRPGTKRILEDVAALIAAIKSRYAPSRERSIAITKIEEAGLWLGRAELHQADALAASAMEAVQRRREQNKDPQFHVTAEQITEQIAELRKATEEIEEVRD